MARKVRTYPIGEIRSASVDWNAMRTQISLDPKALWRYQFRLSLLHIVQPAPSKEID